MLKQTISTAAHGLLRKKAHKAVDRLSSREVRALIHAKAPVLGRIGTFLLSEERQRRMVHARVDVLSNGELREAAGDRLPAALGRALAWLDDD